MKTINNQNRNAIVFWILVLLFSLFMVTKGYSQIHVKDDQTFHIGIGNDGVEIEMSRNLYIRAGINLEKAVGAIGINVSDSYDDQFVNHFAIRLGKMHGEPAAVFGVEYGVDKKLSESFFIGARIYKDWEARNTGTKSKVDFGLRIGFYL